MEQVVDQTVTSPSLICQIDIEASILLHSAHVVAVTNGGVCVHHMLDSCLRALLFTRKAPRIRMMITTKHGTMMKGLGRSMWQAVSAAWRL